MKITISAFISFRIIFKLHAIIKYSNYNENLYLYINIINFEV
jgi:hypothetical protein